VHPHNLDHYPVHTKSHLCGAQDGDIDLSLFQLCPPGIKEQWTGRLQAALDAEAASARSPFKVRDVHVINAEVRGPYLNHVLLNSDWKLD
jgi:hypothetical protein